MRPDLQLRALILDGETDQAVVLDASDNSALVAIRRGQRRVTTDFAVRKGDLVTVRAGRVISKRTGGDGGAVKTYYV